MAQILEQRIRQLGPAPYIILGDFNTNYDEWRESRTEGFDNTRGVVGLNAELRTVRCSAKGDTFFFVTKQDMWRGDSFLHFDCWLDLPPDKRCSRRYNGQNETPDHILLPSALFGGHSITYCDRSFDVFTWDGKLLRNGEPFEWQMSGYGKRRFHIGEGYSDHLCPSAQNS